MIDQSKKYDQKQLVGRKGEELACQFLAQKKFKILSRNFHSRYGEIDIIASRDGIMHFCEVKTRTTMTFGTPEEAVNSKKLQKMKKTIQCYQQQFGYAPWQVDLLALHLTSTLELRKITYYQHLPLDQHVS